MKKFKLILFVIMTAAFFASPLCAEKALLSDKELMNITGQAYMEEFIPTERVQASKKNGVTKSVFYRKFRKQADHETVQTKNPSNSAIKDMLTGRDSIRADSIEQKLKLSIYINEINLPQPHKEMINSGVHLEKMVKLLLKFTM